MSYTESELFIGFGVDISDEILAISDDTYFDDEKYDDYDIYDYSLPGVRFIFDGYTAHLLYVIDRAGEEDSHGGDNYIKEIDIQHYLKNYDDITKELKKAYSLFVKDKELDENKIKFLRVFYTPC